MKKLTNIPTLQLVHKAVACLMAFCIINTPVWAISITDPGGAAVTSGPNAAGGTTTNFGIGAGRTQVEATNFDILVNDIVNINGPGNNYSFIANVTSTDVTSINGQLNGGLGHVIIINPNGIVFGPLSQVTAGQFTASTLAVEDIDAFISGDGSWFKTADVKGMIELQDGSKITADTINLIAQEIRNSGQLIAKDLIVLATGDEIFLGSTADDIVVKVDPPTNADNLSYSIFNSSTGSVECPDGTIVLAAGDTFAQALGGLHGQAYTVSEYTVAQGGKVEADTLEVGAANAILTMPGSETLADNVNMGAQSIDLYETLVAEEGNINLNADYAIKAIGDVSAGGSLTVETENSTILMAGEVTSGGTMDMTSGTALTIGGEAQSGDSMNLDAATNVILMDDVTVANNDLTITAGDTTLARGNLTAANNIQLNTDLALVGDGDQSITAENGGIVANGEIKKYSQNGGELYIAAEKNIQLNDNITNTNGGVSIISEGGMIHSGSGDTLEIAISGYSDYLFDEGVVLPYGEGRAAIVLMSKEDLKLGVNAYLEARGYYISSDEGNGMEPGTDDRAGIDLLTEDQKIIGDYPRDAGQAIDVAIYLASTEGNVEISTPLIVVANGLASGEEGIPGTATVVFDAFDTVAFNFDTSMLQNLQSEVDVFNFRLEVVSRMTEWLGDAIANGTLPFADNPEAMEAILGNDYVLRGAGVEENNYKEAWVLEDMPATDIPPAPLQHFEQPTLKGCPAEMDAAASELAVNTEDLQVMISSSMATNPNIQPCQACSNLLSAAATLKDIDGTRMAALAQIFDTLAPSDAPFTPEVQASIATAFADMSEDNPQYALASEYIDAFAAYVAILDSDLKLPVGDSVALVMEKYGNGITGSDNPNIAAYLASLMEGNGGTL